LERGYNRSSDFLIFLGMDIMKSVCLGTAAAIGIAIIASFVLNGM
jgi:hypothetical protein